jgi:hypothetical protein
MLLIYFFVCFFRAFFFGFLSSALEDFLYDPLAAFIACPRLMPGCLARYAFKWVIQAFGIF